jgi:multidrug efflux pump subunit AcrB
MRLIVPDNAKVAVIKACLYEPQVNPPGEATKQAMREITAPILAITLVLLSVFVPVAFIPASPVSCSANSPSLSGFDVPVCH